MFNSLKPVFMKKLRFLIPFFLLLSLYNGLLASSDFQLHLTTNRQSCVSPATISVSSVSASGASLNWSTAPTALFYQYKLTNSPLAPASGNNASVTYYNASGLAASTTYYFHVRSFCGSGYSSWNTVSFTTEGTPADPDDEILLMSYNLLNYPGSNGSAREPHYRTIIDSLQPDVLVVQELSDPSGMSDLLQHVLNYNSSVYSAGTFLNGPDSDNGLFYKASVFEFISNTSIGTDLRDINAFMLKHLASGDTLIIYAAHLKAGSNSSDEVQRGTEVDSLRKVTNQLHPGAYFVVCGDFNFYSSSETAYQKLLSVSGNGKFNDVLSMSGTWNSPSYALYHTQSPRTTSFGGGANGGLDDRFDLILFSDGIYQSGGFDIVTNSYKVYGNDGQHYNQALNTPPYGSYSSTTASALHAASDHLPVIVRLKYTSPASALSSGLREAETRAIRQVYPNPAHETVTVILENTSYHSLFLRDAQGKLLFTREIKDNETELKLSLSDLSPGTYYLHCESGDAFELVVR